MRDIEMLTSPASLVLYAVPLALIVAITVVRAGVLSWRLLAVARPRMPLDRVLDGAVSADDLARAALANRVSRDPLSEELLAQLRTGPRVELDTALRSLRAADVRFDYLWRRMAIRVSSTWNLMRLTLLAAGLITTGLFFEILDARSYGHRNRIFIIAGLDQAIGSSAAWLWSLSRRRRFRGKQFKFGVPDKVEPWIASVDDSIGRLRVCRRPAARWEQIPRKVSKPKGKAGRDEQAVSVDSSSNLGRRNGHRPTLRMAP